MTITEKIGKTYEYWLTQPDCTNPDWETLKKYLGKLLDDRDCPADIKAAASYAENVKLRHWAHALVILQDLCVPRGPIEPS